MSVFFGLEARFSRVLSCLLLRARVWWSQKTGESLYFDQKILEYRGVQRELKKNVLHVDFVNIVNEKFELYRYRDCCHLGFGS